MMKKLITLYALVFLSSFEPGVAMTPQKDTHAPSKPIYTFDQALEECKRQKLSLPAPESDGRIQTLNRTGATSPHIDEATAAFIESARGKVLEFGGAYGLVMEATLRQQPKIIYHINDLSKEHLFIAASTLEKAKLEKETLKNTRFIIGDITKNLHHLEHYDHILVARVLHFLTPDKLEAAIANINAHLNPGGKVYVVAITPFVKRFKNFISEYQLRLARGDKFPGYVSSLMEWVNDDGLTPQQRASISPEPFMFLDPIVLRRLFENQGFNVLRCETVGIKYHSDAWALDGRENVIMIAEKKMVSKL